MSSILLRPFIQHILSDNIDRIVLVSNDPRIAPEAFDLLRLSERDVVVQFNHSAHNKLIAPTSCAKGYFFQSNHLGGHWGIDDNGKARFALPSDALGPVGYFFLHRYGNTFELFRENVSESSTIDVIRVFEKHNEPWKSLIHKNNYPKDKAPTAGFIGVQVIRSLSQWRSAVFGNPLRIILLGFTGSYPKNTNPWNGHDYEYEQCMLRSMSEIVRLDFSGCLLASE